MWTNYFKSSYLHQYITLGIIQLVLWFPYFTAPDQLIIPESSTPLYLLIYSFLSNKLLVAGILGCVIIFLQALLLNYFLAKNNFIATNSLFPAFIFIVISSSLLSVHTITPVMLVNFFPLFLISSLNTLYKENEPIKTLYDCGIVLGISALLYNQAFFLIALVYACMFVMRLFSWRVFISPLIGLITIVIFTTSYYFITDNFSHFAENIALNTLNYKFDLTANQGFSLVSLIILSILSLIIMVSLVKNFLSRNKRNIDIRKKILTATHQFFFILIFWMFSYSSYNSILILIVPVTSLLAYYTANLKRNKLINFLFWVILLLTLYNNITDNWLTEGGI